MRPSTSTISTMTTTTTIPSTLLLASACRGATKHEINLCAPGQQHVATVPQLIANDPPAAAESLMRGRHKLAVPLTGSEEGH